MVNPAKWIKMLATGLLSLIAIVLFLLNKKSKARKLIMIAMILCSIGDVFMTNLFKINGTVSMAIGASAFIAGHLFYAQSNRVLVKQNNGKVLNPGFYIGWAVALVPEITMIIMSFTPLASEPTFILYAIFVPLYVIMIGVHISYNFSYSYTIKSWRSILMAFGVTLFYVTDIWIFLNMYNICDIESAIWHFYPVAQLMIILFAVPILKKENK